MESNTEKDIQLSFIIPAYNCEKYIEDCINSLLAQDLPQSQFEIIVINDGSTDNTTKILQNKSLQHSNIHILCQENKGRHHARNLGAAIAKGRYIWFIDNDDIIAKNCIKSIINTADLLSLDVLAIAPPKEFKKEFPSSFNYKEDVSKPISGKDFLRRKATYWAPWEFLIRRDFYEKHNFKFKLRYFLEDIELLYRIFYYARNIAEFKNFSCYAYIKRPESETMNPWTYNKIMDYARYSNLLKEFIDSQVVEEDIKHKLEVTRTQYYIMRLNNWKTIRAKMPLSHYINGIEAIPRTTYGSFAMKLYQRIAFNFPYIFTLIKK